MSDYLNNLAARALERHETIRPRLASRFEPTGGAHDPLPAGLDATETISVEPAADSLSTIRAPASTITTWDKHHAPASDMTPRTATPLSPPPQTPTGETPREGRAETEESPVILKEAESISRTRSSRTADDKNLAAPTSSGARTIAPTQIEIPRDENRAPRNSTGGAQTDEAHDVAESKVSALEERVAALEAATERARKEIKSPNHAGAVNNMKPPAPPPPAITPRPAPTIAPRAAAHENAPPHVFVTIGRVDVRAVFPAPAETPRRAAAPRPAPTTLAEYLKQRERGRG